MMTTIVRKSRPYLLGANRSGYLPRLLNRRLSYEAAAVRVFVNDCLAKKTQALSILRCEDPTVFSLSPLSLTQEMASPQKPIGKNEVQVTISDGTKTIVENYPVSNRTWEKDARQAWDGGAVRSLDMGRPTSELTVVTTTILVTLLVLFLVGIISGYITIGAPSLKSDL